MFGAQEKGKEMRLCFKNNEDMFKDGQPIILEVIDC